MTERLRAAAQALVARWDSPQWGGSAERLRHTGEYIAELRAALAEQPAEQEPVAQRWQPIETAPKGRIVLVYYKNSLGNGRTMRARYYLPETLDSDTTESGWADEGWYEESEAYEYLMPLEHDPTHWMPLPAGPDTAPQPAKPAEQEPVRTEFNRVINHAIEQGFEASTFLRCWREGDWSSCKEFGFDPNTEAYTAPQPAKRVPLTDEEITAIAFTQHNYPQGTVGSAMFRKGVRYAEAARGITGETK